MLINDMDVSDRIIFTSGRISIDLVLKAVKVLIPIVVTNSSVTHSAVHDGPQAGPYCYRICKGKQV